MAKKNQGGGFVYNVFNIGFTVFMFVLPTILLAYWYYYIHKPGLQQQQQIVVQQRSDPSNPPPRSMGSNSRRKQPQSSGIFSENPTGVQPISPARVDQTPPAFDHPAKQKTPKLDRNLPSRQQHEMRTWSDSSGKFTVQAKFYSASSGKVKLITADERKIEVDVSKLCDADRVYLRTLFKSKGIRADF